MNTAEKLHALPKAALVELAMRLATERNAARAEADHATAAAKRWRQQVMAGHDYIHWTARQVRDFAQAELDAIGPDPDAARHLDNLLNEIDLIDAERRPAATPQRARRTGPRCHKGRDGKVCGKPLSEDGLCSRHDARTIRAARAAA